MNTHDEAYVLTRKNPLWGCKPWAVWVRQVFTNKPEELHKIGKNKASSLRAFLRSSVGSSGGEGGNPWKDSWHDGSQNKAGWAVWYQHFSAWVLSSVVGRSALISPGCMSFAVRTSKTTETLWKTVKPAFRRGRFLQRKIHVTFYPVTCSHCGLMEPILNTSCDFWRGVSAAQNILCTWGLRLTSLNVFLFTHCGWAPSQNTDFDTLRIQINKTE